VANSVAEGMESSASKALSFAGDALGVAGAVLLSPGTLNSGEDQIVAERNVANSSAPDQGTNKMEDSKQAIFERLKHSVQLLASLAEVQLRLLPYFVCKADELALEFDQWREVTVHNYQRDLTTEQLSSLAALDEKLDYLTTKGREHWTDKAVNESPEWQEVRRLASRVLEVFHWPLEAPPSHSNEYKPADQTHKHSVN
jgi:hypothetical protein